MSQVDIARIKSEGAALVAVDRNGEQFKLADREAWTVERAQALLPVIEAWMRVLADAKGMALFVIEGDLRKRGEAARIAVGTRTFRVAPAPWVPLVKHEAVAIRATLAEFVGKVFSQEDLDAAVRIEQVPATEQVVANHGQITKLAAAAGEATLKEIDEKFRRRSGLGDLKTS